MEDKIITCIQCENLFTFTIAEQKRFVARGFNAPKRCPECRKKKSRGIVTDETWKGKERKRHGRQRNDYEPDEM